MSATALLGVQSAGLAMVAVPPPPGEPTINVIGRKPEEIRKEAQAFVKVTGVAERPVARWLDPICPGVLEVQPDVARRIEVRIREIARAAGARIAPGRCVPNLKIIFSADATGLIRQVASKSPDSFADLDAEGRATMRGSRAPVRWWHTVQERTSDGMKPMANDTPPAAGMNVGSGAVVLGGQVFQQYRSSFLSSQMARGIISARVVIDVKLAEGVPVDSVAAYAALVGLAEIRFGEEAPPNSILGLFAKDGPRDLTPLDQNFLRTLYKMPLDRTAIAHRGLLVRGITKTEARDR